MQRRTLAFAALWVTLAHTAAAQGPPDERARADPVQTIGFDYSYANFQGDIDSWHMGALSLGDRRASGSFVTRLNVARRFATNGTQIEADAYPTLGKGAYGYLNAGYSGSAIYPEWRFGGEYFRNLPRAYHASLGFRQLRFGGPPITLFTGTVGRYTGDYWISLRPYLQDRASGLAASASLTARKYREDADNYVGARIGYGSSPSEEILAWQLTRASSMTAAVNGSGTASARTITSWSLSYEREALAPSRYRNRWEFGGGVKVRF